VQPEEAHELDEEEVGAHRNREFGIGVRNRGELAHHRAIVAAMQVSSPPQLSGWP
jgi:hypothetical protein